MFQDIHPSIGHHHHLELLAVTIADIESVTFTSLTFTNQKKGVCGEVISLTCSGDNTHCPILSLIHWVKHPWSVQANPEMPLACIWDALGGKNNTKPNHHNPLQFSDLLRSFLGFLTFRCLCTLPPSSWCKHPPVWESQWWYYMTLQGSRKSDKMLQYLLHQAGPMMHLNSDKSGTNR